MSHVLTETKYQFCSPPFLPSLVAQKNQSKWRYCQSKLHLKIAKHGFLIPRVRPLPRAEKNGSNFRLSEVNGIMTTVGWQLPSLWRPDGGVKCGVWHFCVQIRCPRRKCWATKEGSRIRGGLWSSDTWQNAALIIVIFILGRNAWA